MMYAANMFSSLERNYMSGSITFTANNFKKCKRMRQGIAVISTGLMKSWLFTSVAFYETKLIYNIRITKADV